MLQVRARSFVRAHPHFVRVRAYTLDRCSTLDPHFAQVRAWHSNHRLMLPVRARPFCECPVRARSFERAHPLAASLLYMALRRWPSKCWAAAAGAERLVARGRARPNPAGCGEVTSPLFSITSILNATSYKGSPGPVNVEIVDYH